MAQYFSALQANCEQVEKLNGMTLLADKLADYTNTMIWLKLCCGHWACLRRKLQVKN